MKTYSKTPDANEEIREVDCPLCGKNHTRLLWSIEGAPYVRCRACGLVRQNPRPSPKALAARYDKEYFEYEIENEEIFFKLMMLGLDDAAFFDKIAPTLPPQKTILDVGCATGRFLKHFKNLGWKTSGVELCRESAEYGNQLYDVGIHAGTLETAAFPQEHFSAVHASHLIEHVDDPGAFAREIHRILIPGGVFICVTPSIDGFQSRLYGKAWRSAIPDHVTLFSKRTLRRLLEGAGLKVEVVKTWGGLAAGSAPEWIKRPMDRIARKLGFGDVVLMVSRVEVP